MMLTAHQKAVFDFIVAAIDATGAPPSTSAITQRFRIGTVQSVFNQLRIKGALVWDRGDYSTMRVLRTDFEVGTTMGKNGFSKDGCLPDSARVRLKTTSAEDGHAHVATFNDLGNGRTTPGPDGHVHRLNWLDVLPIGGHAHQLTEERAQ